MVYFKCMGKISKILISSLLTVSMFLATVICCCIGSAVMEQLHKPSMCKDCATQGSSHSKSSNPTEGCLYHLTSAEISHSHAISFSSPTSSIPNFFDKHLTTPLLPSLISSYPRGSPPLTASFIPLYLRTFTLRI